MRFEKTLSGNPCRLTIKQHVLPRKIISRFANSSTGLVDVICKKPKGRKLLSPKAEIFCAMRQWDQRSEAGFGKTIEDNFNDLIETIINNPWHQFSDVENELATSFYALVAARQDCKYKPYKDMQPASKLVSAEKLRKNDQELLERGGYIFLRETGLPARMANGIEIHTKIMMFRHKYRHIKWAPAIISHGEIVLPEFINFLFLPVSPNMFLTPSKTLDLLRPLASIKLNFYVNALCQRSKYFFARDLSKCFGFNLSDPWAFHPYHLPVSKPFKV